MTKSITDDGLVFTIELLPAGHGDCIWIEYGDPQQPGRILIDTGPPKAAQALIARVNELDEDDRAFALFVMTHIDGDHIGGAEAFLRKDDLGVSFSDIWFNGWDHLPKKRLGAKQAEIFSTIIRDDKHPWNEATGGGPIMVSRGEFPQVTLDGGMHLTVLSPTHRELWNLRSAWEKEVRKHGLAPGSRRQYRRFLAAQPSRSKDVPALAATQFRNDGSKPNAASIAFLAEFNGLSVLFTGDAHAPVLAASIALLNEQRGTSRLAIDALKVSHHGSRANTNIALAQLLECPRYLVSTDGSYFNHPDREAIARIIQHSVVPPTFYFNSRTIQNEVWAEPALQQHYQFNAIFPEREERGLHLDLAESVRREGESDTLQSKAGGG